MAQYCVCCKDDETIAFSIWADDYIVYDEYIQAYFCRKHADMLYSELGPDTI